MQQKIDSLQKNVEFEQGRHKKYKQLFSVSLFAYLRVWCRYKNMLVFKCISKVLLADTRFEISRVSVLMSVSYFKMYISFWIRSVKFLN